MGLKAGLFSETLILCVFLILDTRNIASGCKLFYPDGKEVDLTPLAGDTAFVGEEKISDDRTPGPLYTFSAEGISRVDLVSEEEHKYLDYAFNGTTLTITISDIYKDWKKIEDETYTFFLSVPLQLDCIPQRVEFRAQITNFTNKYPPEFQEPNYKIKLPMPLPAGYIIVGKGGEVMIEATDYDYNSQYKSGVIFSLRDPVEDLEVTTLEREGKKWGVSLKTKNTFNIEEPLTITLVARDVAPDGVADGVLMSEVSITLEPDIEASTPASPLFSEPIYILDIRKEEDINPIKATLVEGYSAPYEVELVHSHGESKASRFQ